MRTAILWVLMAAAAPAFAGSHKIVGSVVDGDEAPVSRALVRLIPGNIQLVTDNEGRFTLDYLRDDAGKRVRLKKRTDYVIEVSKPGFHVHTTPLHYRRGVLSLPTLVLVEETVRVEDSAETDPGPIGPRP